jgi:uncharacterized protein YndB with AHSA1/START domain
MRFAHATTIAVPIVEVFVHLDDSARRREWMAGLVDVAYDKPGIPRGVGTRFVHRVRRSSDVVEHAGQITAYRPPSELGIRLELERYGIETVYRLAAEPAGTRVEQITVVEPKSALAHVLSMVAPWPLRRRQRHLLASLKEIAEQAHHRDSKA